MRKSIESSVQRSAFSPRRLSGQGVQRSPFTVQRSGERGVALVLTLGILALVTLLLIAFVTSMRVENMASRNFNDLIRARQLAQAAVDEAVATIRAATPVITNSPFLVTYFTSPGLIITNFNTPVGMIWSNAALYSAIDPAISGTDPQIDLNAGNWITGTNGSSPLPPPPHTPFYVGWIPVGANGQVLGRFAYWVDDESTKVNINVAGTRGNDPEGRTPAAIDLQVLFAPQDQVRITSFTAVLPFDTLESIKTVTNYATGNGINQDNYYTNQFYMTVNSSSPDLTPWGTKRTNVVWIATNTVFTTAAQRVTGIANALSSVDLTNWFGLGRTFAGKYPNLAQIAANIIDYIDTDSQPTDSGGDPPAYLGLEQTPYLNELVISNTITGAPGGKQFTLSGRCVAELWYMYTNSAGWTAPGNPQVVIGVAPTILMISNAIPPSATPGRVAIQVTSSMGSNNSYAGVSAPANYNVTTFFVPSTGTPVNVVFNSGSITVLFTNSSGRIDYAQVPVAGTNISFITGTFPPQIHFNWVSACNDPRVKPISNNWTPLPTGSETLGAQNPSPSVLDTNVTTVNIRADGDTSCHIISGNLPEPPTGSRDRGNMYPGELGFIHTGVPWRTFWLQPRPPLEVTAGLIPDWAVLDLFSATDATNVIGRININAAITNGNAAATPPVALPPPRTTPLMALLINNVAGYPAYVREAASTNFYYFGNIWINNVVLPQLWFRFPALAGLPAFALAGEICEVPGLAIPPPAPKSIAEMPVRGIANLITTRSNTFSIWAIAQSIKDVNRNGFYDPGTDIITGEVKVQAIVERYENPPGPDGISGNADDVRFRTKYYRYYYQ